MQDGREIAAERAVLVRVDQREHLRVEKRRGRRGLELRPIAVDAPRVVEEPPEEEFPAEAEAETPAAETEEEEEDIVPTPEREEEPEEDEEEEEF